MKHKQIMPIGLVLIILVGMSGAVRKTAAEDPGPRSYLCYRATNAVLVDGKLGEREWGKVKWTDAFVDIEGKLRESPRFETRVKMQWDDQYFYVGAWMEEPHVWATLTRHDAVIFHDNDFEVFIDPDGDNHEYYEFEINALNTGWDLLLPKPYKDDGNALNNWEIPGLKTAVHISGSLNEPGDSDRGWSVEMAFPWKVLAELAHRKTPPKEGDQWRINFSRVEWKHEVVEGKYRKKDGLREDNWVWSPQGVINMHRPETWGFVQFSSLEPGKARYKPDRAQPIRMLLHQIYYAQKGFRSHHDHWASSLKELGLSTLSHPMMRGPIKIETTDHLFQVTAKIELPDGRGQTWHIGQDAHVWSQN